MVLHNLLLSDRWLVRKKRELIGLFRFRRWYLQTIGVCGGVFEPTGSQGDPASDASEVDVFVIG